MSQETVAKYINPLTDFGFKKLFGTEPNKNLLIDFLNELLPKRHQIKDLSYAKNEHLGAKVIDRSAVFDLYCIGENKERFIVEMQKAKQNYFKDRSVYYSSFPIQEQAKKKEWDYRLTPVYTVGILDFIFEEHKSETDLVHLVELKDQNCKVFYDKLKYIYVELPKFVKTETELDTHFDKWLFVLRHLSNLQNRPEKLQEKVFQQIFKVAEIAKFSNKEKEAYQKSLKTYRDINNVVDTAREEGMEEGVVKGRKEGIEEGKIKGKKEFAVELARKMKKDGKSNEQIKEYTGLTDNEIDNLLN